MGSDDQPHTMPMTNPAIEQTRAHGQRGSMLIMVAISIVAMLVFSSIVFDLGQVMLARRQDQAAVDAAALAAVWDLRDQTTLLDIAVDSLNLNLGGDPLTAADLNTCSAEPLPPGWVVYPTANCLARNSSWDELRLRLPTRSLDTTFAGLVGIMDLDHTAFAHAAATNSVTIFPFALEAGAAGSQCLKSGNGNIPAGLGCDTPIQGSFGGLKLTHFGSSDAGTSWDCNGTSQFYDGIAQGLDHNLSIYDGSGSLTDVAACGSSDNHALLPNAGTPGTGNNPNGFAEALYGDFSAPDGQSSRLRRTAGLSTFNTLGFGGGTVDDTPLWAFINPNLDWSDNVPYSCYLENFIGDAGGLNEDEDMWMTAMPVQVYTYLLANYGLVEDAAGDRTTALMERCFLHYRGLPWDDHGLFSGTDADFGLGCIGTCDDAVFSVDTEKEGHDVYDIQASPRFGYTPEMLPGEDLGDNPIHYAQFRAVYLQRILTNCSNKGCSNIFDPGVGHSPSNPSHLAHALTALVIPAGMLPEGLGGDSGLAGIGVFRFAELTR